MKSVLKYLGTILVILGIVPLLVYHFGTVQNNAMLAVSGIVIVLGAILHVIINKRVI